MATRYNQRAVRLLRQYGYSESLINKMSTRQLNHALRKIQERVRPASGKIKSIY